MKLHLGRVAAATSILLSLYACASVVATPDARDAGLPPGDDGSGGSSGSSGSSGGDSSSNPDAPADAPTLDSATDADATIDADATVDAEVDAGTPAVRFIGRFDMGAAGGPKVAWPGAQIIARFSGTEVKATFSDEMLFSDYGANRWEVFVDGAFKTTLQLNRALPTTYTLATALPLGPHTVELYKLTEGNIGTTQFRGFDFSGGTLLAPPPPKTRHMQFLGDSASNGYGIEGVRPCVSSAANENERKSYPALIAKDLSADSHDLTASGKGLYQNNYRPDTDVFSVLYQLAGVYSGAPPWNYADYTPDVVWMTLGGNDYDDPDGNPNNPPDVPPAGQFQAKYDQLVTTVRAQHPNAHIFCAVAPSLNDGYPVNYNAYTNVKTAAQNVVNAHTAAADTKIYFFEFTRSADADLTACDYHPNAAKHRAMADEAMLLIKAKTGW